MGIFLMPEQFCPSIPIYDSSLSSGKRTVKLLVSMFRFAGKYYRTHDFRTFPWFGREADWPALHGDGGSIWCRHSLSG